MVKSLSQVRLHAISRILLFISTCPLHLVLTCRVESIALCLSQVSVAEASGRNIKDGLFNPACLIHCSFGTGG